MSQRPRVYNLALNPISFDCHRFVYQVDTQHHAELRRCRRELMRRSEVLP